MRRDLFLSKSGLRTQIGPKLVKIGVFVCVCPLQMQVQKNILKTVAIQRTKKVAHKSL